MSNKRKCHATRSDPFRDRRPGRHCTEAYYRELFDWSIDADNPMNYGMVSPVAPGIGGGVGPTPHNGPHVTFDVETDDLQASLDKAEALGGKTVMPPMDIPDGPSIAQFADPAGNVIGLAKSM